MPSLKQPNLTQELNAEPNTALATVKKRPAGSSPSLQRRLRSYEKLLQGVAAATNCLLTDRDYADSINRALAILGEATSVDRIYIFETHPHSKTQEPAMSQRWEWAAAGVTPEIDNPELQDLMYREAFPRWYETLSEAHPIVGLTENFPPSEREILVPQGILSILVVPITIQDQFWGFVGFDQCQVAHLWSEVELSTLWAIAGSFGGAIARHKAETSLHTLNASLEARVEERTRALRKANAELFSTLQTLQDTQSQLIHTEKMSSLGQLVAGIAHEINNPANFIQGNLSPAQRHVTDLMSLINAYREDYPVEPKRVSEELDYIDLEFIKEDFPALMNSIRSGSQRISDIVQSLRTFSRLNESELKSVDIHHGIESTLSLLQHRLTPEPKQPNQCAIKVVKRYSADAPLIECYPGSLNQVFMTLLLNAIEAIEAAMKKSDRNLTQGQIEIQTDKHIDNRLSIRISDNGQGISKESINKIFDPFFTTKPVGQGTGLGLSIAHQIVVQQHNGALQCRSQPKKGTSFTIEIPLAQNRI